MSAPWQPPTCEPPQFFRRDPRSGRVINSSACVIHDPRTGATWTIPERYEHDGVSVPRLFRSGLDDNDLSPEGGMVHDDVYRRNGDMGPGNPRYTRAMADRLFDDFNRRDNVHPVKRRAGLRGVQLGGWWPWWKHGRRIKRERKAARALLTAGERVQRALALPQTP